MRNAPYILIRLALAACTAPTTDNPNVTEAEWRAEGEAQAIAAKQAPLDFNEK